MNKAKEKILLYNCIATTVRNPQSLRVEKFCNGWDVVNTGTVVATVNGIPLNPPAAGEVLGDSASYGGNKGEIYVGRIDVAFAGAGGQVIVTQKIYVIDHAEQCFLEDTLNK